METERVSGEAWSELVVSGLTYDDTGQYSCHSDLAIASSVHVYVTSGRLNKTISK